MLSELLSEEQIPDCSKIPPIIFPIIKVIEVLGTHRPLEINLYYCPFPMACSVNCGTYFRPFVVLEIMCTHVNSS